jgi:predicted deacetylase
VWSVRSAWRRATSLAWNACLARVLTRRPLLRISIHPVDWSHAAVKRQILDLATKTIARREALTYQNWIARQRAAAF